MSKKIVSEDVMKEKSLVTFALFAYNQEKYIREAVESAFSQEYSPLEIILSDDCSSDKTFEIMQEMAAEYAGYHKVILNKNKRNHGVGEHVNRIVELAKGDLIICAAGDDISLPQRTSELVSAWIDSDRKATSIYSGMILIDESSNFIGSRSNYSNKLGDIFSMSSQIVLPHGAAHAFSRKLMLDFGELDPAVVNEDQVIGYRSALAGGFKYVDKNLIKYRVHREAANSGLLDINAYTPDQMRLVLLRDAERACIYRQQNITDSSKLLKDDHPILEILRKQIQENSALRLIYSPDFKLFGSIKSFLKMLSLSARSSIVAKACIKRIVWPVYARYYDFRRRLHVYKKYVNK